MKLYALRNSKNKNEYYRRNSHGRPELNLTPTCFCDLKTARAHINRLKKDYYNYTKTTYEIIEFELNETKYKIIE